MCHNVYIFLSHTVLSRQNINAPQLFFIYLYYVDHLTCLFVFGRKISYLFYSLVTLKFSLLFFLFLSYRFLAVSFSPKGHCFLSFFSFYSIYRLFSRSIFFFVFFLTFCLLFSFFPFTFSVCSIVR